MKPNPLASLNHFTVPLFISEFPVLSLMDADLRQRRTSRATAWGSYSLSKYCAFSIHRLDQREVGRGANFAGRELIGLHRHHGTRAATRAGIHADGETRRGRRFDLGHHRLVTDVISMAAVAANRQFARRLGKQGALPATGALVP